MQHTQRSTLPNLVAAQQQADLIAYEPEKFGNYSKAFKEGSESPEQETISESILSPPLSHYPCSHYHYLPSQILFK